jgi:hypothetical protein
MRGVDTPVVLFDLVSSINADIRAFASFDNNTMNDGQAYNLRYGFAVPAIFPFLIRQIGVTEQAPASSNGREHCTDPE